MEWKHGKGGSEELLVFSGGLPLDEAGLLPGLTILRYPHTPLTTKYVPPPPPNSPHPPSQPLQLSRLGIAKLRPQLDNSPNK